MDNIIVKKPINIKISHVKLLSACTELVTVNGRLFSIPEDTGFKKIFNPILDGFENSFSIDKRNVRKNVIETAISVRNNLKSLVKNCILSLKIDGATRKDKSILGINVRFMSK